MKELLDRIKGKYLLNINEDEFVLQVFGKPQIRKEYTNFGVNRRVSDKTKRIELFYYNGSPTNLFYDPLKFLKTGKLRTP